MLLFIQLLYLFFSTFSNIPITQDQIKVHQVELAAIRFILTDESNKLYSAMSDSEKEIWVERFWRAMDPTPTTERNEYYTEFHDRVIYAMDNYHNLIKPYYFDDRGKYYIKYGLPDNKVESVGIGKEYKSNITWAYYNFNMIIDFVEYEGYGYREVTDLTEAIRGVPLNEKVRIARDLYLERTDISSKYLAFRRAQEDFEFFNNVQEISQEKELAIEKSPPATYSFKYKKESLTVGLASCTFKEDANHSRVEIYYAIPLHELNYKVNENNYRITHLYKDIIIYNQNYEQILKRSEKIPLYARLDQNLSNRSYVNQHNEELPPGEYHLAFRIENPESGRLSILKSQLHVRDFSLNHLAISDIQFAHQVRINAKGKYLKPNNIQVIPYISQIIRRIKPIMIYFEIYNLTLDNNGKSKFRVSYEISQTESSENLITDTATKIANFFGGNQQPAITGTSFESSGDSSFEQIYSSLDFSSTNREKKQLKITLTDLLSSEVDSTSTTFILQ